MDVAKRPNAPSFELVHPDCFARYEEQSLVFLPPTPQTLPHPRRG